MRRIIPIHGKIIADAVISIQPCVIKFIRYMTAEAKTRCGEGMSTAMTAQDVLIALNKLGFNSPLHWTTFYLSESLSRVSS